MDGHPNTASKPLRAADREVVTIGMSRARRLLSAVRGWPKTGDQLVRRLIVVSLLALLLSLNAGASSVAAAKDNTGPACTDLKPQAAVSYQPAEGTGPIVDGVIAAPAGSCASAIYLMHVIPFGLSEFTVTPDPTQSTSTQLRFTDGSMTEAPGSICAYFTSQVRRNVADRYPDDGCISVPLGSKVTDDGGPTE